MIILSGSYTDIEGLTIDLRRALLAVGVVVVRELTEGEGERLVRRLWVRRIE